MNNLTPLTILVGGNGSGKSTVLEALLIGASNQPEDALGRAINRRIGTPLSFRALFWKLGRDGDASIVVQTDAPASNARVTNILYPEDDSYSVNMNLRLDPPNFSATVEGLRVNFEQVKPPYYVQSYKVGSRYIHHLDGVSRLRLVDPQKMSYASLPEMYSFMRTLGQDVNDNFQALVKEILPDVKEIAMLDFKGSDLHLIYKEYSVPVSVAGDGVYATIRQALELVTQSRGVVLLEEPEVHLHYRLLYTSSKLIWAAIKRGIQIVLTTHSLEFIDALLEAAPTTRMSTRSLLSAQTLWKAVCSPVAIQGKRRYSHAAKYRTTSDESCATRVSHLLRGIP